MEGVDRRDGHDHAGQRFHAMVRGRLVLHPSHCVGRVLVKCVHHSARSLGRLHELGIGMTSPYTEGRVLQDRIRFHCHGPGIVAHELDSFPVKTERIEVPLQVIGRILVHLNSDHPLSPKEEGTDGEHSGPRAQVRDGPFLDMAREVGLPEEGCRHVRRGHVLLQFEPRMGEMGNVL